MPRDAAFFKERTISYPQSTLGKEANCFTHLCKLKQQACVVKKGMTQNL